jgi:hypothetical protein
LLHEFVVLAVIFNGEPAHPGRGREVTCIKFVSLPLDERHHHELEDLFYPATMFYFEGDA